MIETEQAVVLDFSGPARAISLYHKLQHLKRQKDALEKKQGFFSWDRDREKVIEALDTEIERVRSELEKEKEKDTEERK